MKKIETFIFVHDQEIILDFINKKRFSNIGDFKYVFLSERPTDKIDHLDNVIIVNNLEKNIEHLPKFTSFTGWYALVENNLLNSEYVNFFEYDINYVDDFYKINQEIIKKDFDFIGYFPMSISDPVYLLYKEYSIELINSVKNITNIDINQLINEMLKTNPQSMWSSSSNSTWKTSQLINYVKWFSQFIEDIKDSNFCGHMHERSLSFYYFIHNLKVFITRDLMSHLQLNTHKTSPLPPDRFQKLYKNLI